MTGRHDGWLLAAALAAGSAIFSLALACAAPFAGLAAVAALSLSLRGAIAAAVLAFAANQAVGFGLLGYPVTGESLAWGAVLGLSAVAAAVAARLAVAAARDLSEPAVVVSVFVAAFLAQQGTVFAATAVLPAHPDAFAPSVVLSILWTNLLAFAALGLLALAVRRTLALAAGLRGA